MLNLSDVTFEDDQDTSAAPPQKPIKLSEVQFEDEPAPKQPPIKVSDVQFEDAPKPTAIPPDKLAAAEPWRSSFAGASVSGQVIKPADSFDVRANLPKDRPVPPTTDHFDPRANLPRSKPAVAVQTPLEVLQNPVQGQEVSNVTGQPIKSLAQQKQVAQDVQTRKIQQHKATDLHSALEQQRLKTLSELSPEEKLKTGQLIAKERPLTEGEQRALGINPSSAERIAPAVAASFGDTLAGVAQAIPNALTGNWQRGMSKPDNYVSKGFEDAAQSFREEANQYGKHNLGGDLLEDTGTLVPDIAGTFLLPEGKAVQALYWAGSQGLKTAARGGTPEDVVESGLVAAALPAVLHGTAGLPWFKRLPYSGGAMGLLAAAQGGDPKAIARSFILGAVMSIPGGQRSPEEVITKAVESPDLQRTVFDHYNKATPETEAALRAAAESAGLKPAEIDTIVEQAKPKPASSEMTGTEEQKSTATPTRSIARPPSSPDFNPLEPSAFEAKMREGGLNQPLKKPAEPTRTVSDDDRAFAAHSDEEIRRNSRAIGNSEKRTEEFIAEANEIRRAIQQEQPASVAPTRVIESSTEQVKPDAESTASVKAFITKADEANLRKLGHTDEDIYRMKPADAQTILDGGNAKPQAAEFTTPGPIEDVGAAKIPERTLPENRYPIAEKQVGGLTVRDKIPNQGSIESTLSDYDTLPGIRQIPLSDFPNPSAKDMFYAKNDFQRVEKLAEQIKQSGEINPLIVVMDKEGPYVLEGGHRLAALERLGIKEIPAQVIIDRSEIPRTERAAEQPPIKVADVKFEEPKREVVPPPDTKIPEGATVRKLDVEPPKPEAEAPEMRSTGVKNATVDSEREARSAAPIEKLARKSFGTSYEQGKVLVDLDPIAYRQSVSELVTRPRVLSDSESAALTYDRMRLQNEQHSLEKQIAEAQAKGNEEAQISLNGQLDAVKQHIENNDFAADRVGTQAGRALSIRRMMIREDYSLDNLMRRAKIANDGKPVPEKTAGRLKELAETIKRTNEDLAKQDEIDAQKAADKAVKKVVDEERTAQRRVKRTVNKAKLDNDFDSLKKELAGLFKSKPEGPSKGLGGPEAGAVVGLTLPTEAATILAKMAKNRVQSGMVKATDVVDSIYSDIKDALPDGISKRDIRDAISGYGKTAQLSKDVIDKALRQIKSELRDLSSEEDITGGQAPKRSGLQRDPVTPEARARKQRINQLMRENGIKIEGSQRSPEQQQKSALDGVKTRLKNAIQDLDRQIKTGEKPPKKTGVPLDEEAQALVKERDALRATLDAIQGPRTRSEEVIAETRKAGLRKQIAALDERLGGKPEPPKPDVKTDYDKETVDLMYQRDALKRQLADPTAKNKADVKAKLAETEQRLADGDIGRKTDFPNRVYDDAETAQMRKQLQDLNRQIGDARALPDKVAKLEKQIADVKDRIANSDYAKRPAAEKASRPAPKEIVDLRNELKAANDQLSKARQEATAQESINKRITELQRRIRGRDFSRAARPDAKPVSAEVARLRERRTALQDEYNRLKPPTPMTDAQRIEMATKSLEKSIAEYDRRIAEKDFAAKDKADPLKTLEIEALKQRRDAAKEAYQALKDADPASIAKKQASQNEALRKRLAKRQAELEEMLRTGNFEKTPKAKLPLTAENIKLQNENRAATREVQQIIRRMNESFGQKALRAVSDVINAPKSLLTAIDISAGGRQGLVQVFAHPKVAAEAFVKQFKAMTQVGQARVYDEIQAMPEFGEAKKMGLYFAGEPIRLGGREEAFLSSLPEKIPGLGRVYKGSERAYSAFLDWQRARAYGIESNLLKKSGLTPEANPKDFQAVAKFINRTTGRGDLGEAWFPHQARVATDLLNLPLFSPRFMASRFQMLFGDASFRPSTRRMVGRTLGRYYGGVATVLGLAAAAGLRVSMDPDDPDFMKILFGNTSYDLTRGQSQDFRTAFKVVRGLSNNARDIENTDAQEPGNVILHYLRGKTAPTLGTAIDYREGSNIVGEKFTWGKAALNTVTPMVGRDLYEGYKDSGAPGFIKSLPTVIGVGTQTYKRTPEEIREIQSLATKFKQTNRIPMNQFGGAPSELTTLKRSLETGDLPTAESEINRLLGELRGTKPGVDDRLEAREKIKDAIDKWAGFDPGTKEANYEDWGYYPKFTGSADNEKRFKASLTPAQKKTYEAAVKARADAHKRFLPLWQATAAP